MVDGRVAVEKVCQSEPTALSFVETDSGCGLATDCLEDDTLDIRLSGVVLRESCSRAASWRSRWAT